MSTLETIARNNRRSIDGEWIRENETRIGYGYEPDEEYSYQDEMRTMTDEAEAINKLLDSIELDEDLFDEKEDEKLVEEVSDVERILDSTDVPKTQFEDEKSFQEEIEALERLKSQMEALRNNNHDNNDYNLSSGRKL